VLGGGNTVVLILSSLTMAMASVRASGKKHWSAFFLIATLAPAPVLGRKGIEYKQKF